jgi:chromosome segregation ATPase
MDDARKRIAEMLEELKQERDELKVKLHLGKLEASEEWDKLQVKLEKLEARARDLAGATAEASRDIGAAAKLLGEEIRDGFKMIAKRL